MRGNSCGNGSFFVSRGQGKHITRKVGMLTMKEHLLIIFPWVVRKLKEDTTNIQNLAAICGVSKNTVLKVNRLLTQMPVPVADVRKRPQ